MRANRRASFRPSMSGIASMNAPVRLRYDLYRAGVALAAMKQRDQILL
jgi:hypothetical protein